MSVEPEPAPDEPTDAGPGGAPGLRITAAQPLRLSVLVAELRDGAARKRDQALAPVVATVAPGDPVLIDAADGLSIAEILDATASAGFGFVVALLALTAIPFFGLSTPFGLAIAFVGAQLVAGRTRPWLPARIRRVALSVAALERIGRWLRKGTGWMTHLVRERLRPLTRGAATGLVGLGLIILGLGLALPLPIPGSNMVYIVPVLIYAIGLLERDGLLILVGHLTAAGHVVLAIVAWRVVATAVASFAGCFGG
ncbi:MAG: exopolysaccharide biosynthesis protein [Kofleriaceae bacterium]